MSKKILASLNSTTYIKLFWWIWFSKSQVMPKNLQWYTLHSTRDGMDFHPCSVPWALVFIWEIVWSLYVFWKFKKSSTTLCNVIIARTSTRDSNWCQLCPPPLPLAPSKAISIGSKYFWSCTHKLSLRNMLHAVWSYNEWQQHCPPWHRCSL